MAHPTYGLMSVSPLSSSMSAPNPIPAPVAQHPYQNTQNTPVPEEVMEKINRICREIDEARAISKESQNASLSSQIIHHTVASPISSDNRIHSQLSRIVDWFNRTFRRGTWKRNDCAERHAPRQRGHVLGIGPRSPGSNVKSNRILSPLNYNAYLKAIEISLVGRVIADSKLIGKATGFERRRQCAHQEIEGWGGGQAAVIFVGFLQLGLNQRRAWTYQFLTIVFGFCCWFPSLWVDSAPWPFSDSSPRQDCLHRTLGQLQRNLRTRIAPPQMHRVGSK
ncbi:hypothetical protein M407DRAFT_7140 [Tulasnella calospora MUT 4182]|uniref:Uncharacterized protein n=1 Tax=Tulasnella calospora MUT 4182 TaxID=1051891 RepID=A0A0C3QLV6_9AGAM|nr:hypothetical protein M407DRAFT_7140 [Tulasnella calospora MUT 4182]